MNWIKVTDRLPESHSIVLVCTGDGDMSICLYVANEFTVYNCSSCDSGYKHGVYDVTHWAELPDPPIPID
jgi:hypothetical protein